MQTGRLAAAILMACSCIVLGEQMRDLNLRGDRFRPLTHDQLTAEQKVMVNDLLAGKRTSLNGPFNALLRSPDMGNLSQKLGEYVRFRTSVPARLNEMAILLTARWWSSQDRVPRAQATRAGRWSQRGRDRRDPGRTTSRADAG